MSEEYQKHVDAHFKNIHMTRPAAQPMREAPVSKPASKPASPRKVKDWTNEELIEGAGRNDDKWGSAYRSFEQGGGSRAMAARDIAADSLRRINTEIKRRSNLPE